MYAGAIQNRNHETERKALCLRVTVLVGNDKKDGNKDREGWSDFWQSFCGLLCLRGDLRSGSQEIDWDGDLCAGVLVGSVLWKVSCEAEIKVVLGKERERETIQMQWQHDIIWSSGSSGPGLTHQCLAQEGKGQSLCSLTQTSPGLRVVWGWVTVSSVAAFHQGGFLEMDPITSNQEPMHPEEWWEPHSYRGWGHLGSEPQYLQHGLTE